MRWRIANASQIFRHKDVPLLAQLCETHTQKKSANKGKFSIWNKHVRRCFSYGWMSERAVHWVMKNDRERASERERKRKRKKKQSLQSDCMRFNSISDFILGHFFCWEMPKPFYRSLFIRHVCCLCVCCRAHQLQHSFAARSSTLYIHFKFNSFSIFSSFVPESFKENGKFIEFILTRNMFARRSFTHTRALSFARFAWFVLSLLLFSALHVMLMQSVREHTVYPIRCD